MLRSHNQQGSHLRVTINFFSGCLNNSKVNLTYQVVLLANKKKIPCRKCVIIIFP